MSDATIDRINALTSNARSTWLGLFSVLVFAVVTLVRIEHIDFYGVDRGTQLPLVNITVPTYIFFYAAPILIFAIYGYLHLYLIRLWDALSVAPPWIGRTRLGEAVSPWLITDAALSLREILRRDGCAKRRETDYTSMILNFVISWLSGPFILGWIWCQSMPARDFWMTALGGLMFAGSLAMGSVSLRLLFTRMRYKVQPQPNFSRITAIYFAALSLCAAFILTLTWGRTVEPLFLRDIVNTQGEIVGQSHWIPLAAIDLHDQRLTERPSGWLPYAIAQKEELASWCKRAEVKDCAILTKAQEEEFQDHWLLKRTSQIGDLRKPTHLDKVNPRYFPTKNVVLVFPDEFPEIAWESENRHTVNFTAPDLRFPKKPLDLSHADLRGTFWAGTILTATKMFGTDARVSDFEGAQLQYANISETDFFRANLSGANFKRAVVQRSFLINTHAQGTDFREAQLQLTNFESADAPRALFNGAQLQGANFNKAVLERADFRKTDLRSTFFVDAQLRFANLRHANSVSSDFRDADLSYSDLSYTTIRNTDLRDTDFRQSNLSLSLISGKTNTDFINDSTDFSASTNNGGALRALNLSSAKFDSLADWRNIFLDASVIVSPYQKQRMGDGCQLLEIELTDQEFFGRWRGWLETNRYYKNKPWALPEPTRGVKAIPPPKGCTWATGPLRPEYRGGR